MSQTSCGSYNCSPSLLNRFILIIIFFLYLGCKLKLSKNPVLSDPYINNYGDVKFNCSFEFPSSSVGLEFEVSWTIDGVPLLDAHSKPLASRVSSERTVVLDTYKLGGHMNKMVRCLVVSMFCG